MKSEEFMEKRYVSEIEGPHRKGRLLRRWKDGIKKCIWERGAIRKSEHEQTRECLERERGRLFCHSHPSKDIPGESMASEL